VSGVTGQVRLLASSAVFSVPQWNPRSRSPGRRYACVSLLADGYGESLTRHYSRYYFLNHDSVPDPKIVAFPEGFRMIAGDSTRRNCTVNGQPCPFPDPDQSSWAQIGETSQVDLQQRAIGFNCLHYNTNPESTLYRHFMPTKDFLDQTCTTGLRMELMFPSCWNGKDIDSHDHKSHVMYPDLVMTGTCPDGFKVKLPSLMYETIYNTYLYNTTEGQFVFSNGDPTGE
jgi:hypothetical protein